MKPIHLALLLLALSIAASAQKKTSFNPDEKITADSARHNFREITDELKRKHPGFYTYNNKAAFDGYIHSLILTIQTPQDQLSYYRKIKPVFARIGCLHTGVSLSVSYRDYLNTNPNLFPLKLYFKEDQAFITANYSRDTAIPLGAEILEINGVPIKEIRDRLFAAIPSDGYNVTLKYQLLNGQFSQWYRSVIEVTDTFTIAINTANGRKDYTLAGIASKAMPVPAIMDLGNKPRLDFSIESGLGILTVRSFAQTEIKSGRQDFKKFISEAFEKLNTSGVKDLLIDLRNNTGGTDPNAVYLCGFLMDKPFRYWERIEVTEPFALSIKGAAKFVYGKPIKQDTVYLWQKSKFSHEFDFYEVQQPQKNAFTGKVYVLINGLCMSSCADLAAVLQANRRAVFMGEETGGAIREITAA